MLSSCAFWRPLTRTSAQKRSAAWWKHEPVVLSTRYMSILALRCVYLADLQVTVVEGHAELAYGRVTRCL